MTSQSQTITRRSASNLALAFVLLPKPRREAMAAFYAFCRTVDDVADNETVSTAQRRATLGAWREDIQRACHGQTPAFAVNRELQAVIAKYQLPFIHFDELIRGMEMDLEVKRYPTYEALEQYCYRAASVVGLLSIEIFGYHDPACRDYAIYLGKALQLTNILRDVRSDAARGRIYLPLCELQRCQVTEEEILRGQYSSRFAQLAENVAAEARKYYGLARRTLPAEDRRSMAAAELMGSVYWRLLRKLERGRFQVFGARPARLNKGQKIWLILGAWRRLFPALPSPTMERRDAVRRLIVNADDFGRSHSINEAVIRAHREGILTTASLMVNESAADEAIALARENPKLGVGLHLTLVCGTSSLPREDIPQLVNERKQFSEDPVMTGLRYFASGRCRRQLRAEIAAQFAKFRATGLAMDHVNGHLNMHLHPTVLGILVDNIDGTALRLTCDPFFLNATMAGGRWGYRCSHAFIYQVLSSYARPRLARRQIKHTRAVFGLLQNGLVDAGYIRKLLPRLPAGDSELYSHPSLGQSAHEFDALIDPAIRALAQDLGICLIRYQDL